MSLKNLNPLIIIFVVLFFLFPNCFASSVDSEDAVAFASFIRDLANTTQVKHSGVFCSIGDDEILKVMAIQDKALINLDHDPAKLSSCKFVYVSQNKRKSFKSEIDKFTKSKILTIAVFDGFTESGGMIQVQMGRRNFELVVNMKEVKEAGIRLNSLVSDLIIN